MSGLFRRLARHASGRLPAAVHAMARLPYQAPPALLGAEEAGAPPPLAGPPAVIPPAAGPALATATARPSTPQSAVLPGMPPTPTPPTAMRQERQSPGQTTAPHTHGTTAPDAGGSIAPMIPAVAAPAREAEAIATQAETQAAQIRPPPRMQANAETGMDALPTALLPPEPVTAPYAASASTPIANNRPAPASASEPAEVHVHIGRIEVTAVQAPDPPRRPARSGQAPMSLDAYLAKRQRSPS